MADQVSADVNSSDGERPAGADVVVAVREPIAEPIVTTRREHPPFRFLIPICLIFLVPLMHGTQVGEALMLKGWVLVGLGGAVFSLLMIVSGIRLRAGQSDDALGLAAWSLLIAYLFHQFEEFGIDLYGNVNAFPAYMNGVVAERFPDSGVVLTELSTYRINTLGIWVAFLLAIWAGHRLPWMGLAAAGVMLTNAGIHIGLAFSMGEYNPGLATALLLFLPLSLRYFIVSRHKTEAGWSAALLGILFGIAVHLSLASFVVALNEPHWTPVTAGLLAGLISLPIMANLIARLVSSRRGS
ncbi:MAG: HXXEE domain-containing protein [Parvibaculum sp.]